MAQHLGNRPEQGPTGAAPAIIGNWKGASICQEKESPCNDESVVAHITRGAGRDSFVVQLNKVVGGVEYPNVEVTCMVGAASGSTLCRDGVDRLWRWKLDGDVLNATLIFKGQEYRKMALERVK